jgi:hypothetical protein
LGPESSVRGYGAASVSFVNLLCGWVLTWYV